jgi:valyl-tRNA synthetase
MFLFGKTIKDIYEKIIQHLCEKYINQISKHLVEKHSTERTVKKAFLHKVLSLFQRLSVGAVHNTD